MNENEQAMAFLAEIANGDKTEWSEFYDRVKALPEPVAREVARLNYQYDRRKMDAIFQAEHAGETRQRLSPSGKYRLDITQYATKPGCWNYSRGIVSKLDGDEWKLLGFDVQRNYVAFPFLFIEGHANGHDYLVCGEDYQGQTLLELDTGKERTHTPFEEVFGQAFCWANYEYDAVHQLLVVEGCYWACPYEFRLYDFSQPLEGWPHLEAFEGEEAAMIEQDAMSPRIEGSKVEFFQSEESEGTPDAPRVVLAIKTFERVDHRLVFRSEWVHDKEAEGRRVRAEQQATYDAWVSDFKAHDPLFQLVKEKVAERGWPQSKWGGFGIGVIHDKWCPDYSSPEQKERRICRDVVVTKGTSLAVEWGADTGPIKVAGHVGDVNVPTRFFMQHSTEAMGEALDYVAQLVEQYAIPCHTEGS